LVPNCRPSSTHHIRISLSPVRQLPRPDAKIQYLGGEYGKGLLASALAQPRQTFNGRYLYRTIFDKAAILLSSMIKDHPFVDGNKRMALTTVSVFLTLNRYLGRGGESLSFYRQDRGISRPAGTRKMGSSKFDTIIQIFGDAPRRTASLAWSDGKCIDLYSTCYSKFL